MKLFVVRHGQTIWNSKGKTQGRTNNRLSELGKQQAQATCKKLCNQKIDLIFCSPLCRTVQTAKILNVNNLKIIKDERINEIKQGIYTGTYYNKLTNEQKARKALRLEQDGVESYEQVFKRTKDFIDYLRKENSDRTILIVTHNVVASCIQLICENQGNAKLDNLKLFDNAELKSFEI